MFGFAVSVRVTNPPGDVAEEREAVIPAGAETDRSAEPEKFGNCEIVTILVLEPPGSMKLIFACATVRRNV